MDRSQDELVQNRFIKCIGILCLERDGFYAIVTRDELVPCCRRGCLNSGKLKINDYEP